MSNGFNVGGGSIQMTRDTGTANAVQGFFTSTITQGPNLATALPTTIIQQSGTRAAQFSLIAAATQLWIKVSGVWKQATPWIKVSGVWKQATPWFKDSGTWK